VILAVAIAVLVVAVVVLAAGDAQLRREWRAFHAEKEIAWDRLANREAALDDRETRMLDSHRNLIEESAAERRELLDRIQAPGMVAARLLPDAVRETAEPASDVDVDEAFQKRPESVVEWDPDLHPHPWDLSLGDDVPQPTVEPVRP
jgi:uncharacterized membrane protein